MVASDRGVQVLRVRDDSASRLVLESIAKPVASLQARLGCAASFLIPVIAIAAAIHFLVEDSTFLLIGFGGAAALGTLLLRVVVLPDREVLGIELNSHDRRILVDSGLPGHPPSRSRTLAFSDIESITASVPHGIVRDKITKSLPLRLQIGGTGRSDLLTIDVKIEASQAAGDQMLLGFILRLGSASGLSHHRVVAANPKDFEVRLTRAAEPGSRPVPSTVDDRTAGRSRPAAPIDPVVAAAPVEGAVVELSPSLPLPAGLRLGRVAPGLRIEIVKAWRALDVAVVLAAVLVAGFVAATWWRPEILATDLPEANQRALVSTLNLVFTGAVVVVAWLIRAARYRCEFDLAGGTARIRLNFGWRHFQIRDIDEIVFSNHTSAGGSVDGRQTHGNTQIHSCALRAHLHGGGSQRLMIDVRTPFLERHQLNYRLLYPFAAALASFLGVPFRFADRS